MTSRQALRRELRRRRRALSPEERRRAALAALDRFKSFVKLRRGMRIAVYLAADAELETEPFICHLRARGCEIYAPIVHRYPRDASTPANSARNPHKKSEKTSAVLWFVLLQPPLRRNRFGILEPLHHAHRRIDPRWLDIVLTPLVAFGPHGERLGSGAGFYDQTFSFLRHRRTWRKPRLIGLGYDWQESAALSNETWDVPLSAIVTDRRASRLMKE